MYEYDEIENLLSASFKNVLKDSLLYSAASQEALEIISGLSGSAEKQSWNKLPFVWVLEYIASARISGLSKEQWDIINTKYLQACKICESNSSSSPDSYSANGTIDNLYSIEY